MTTRAAVAMSAYYLTQVVKDWSLTRIYHGMFQFMILQVICIGLVVYFPQIALWFPQTLQRRHERSRSPMSTRRSSSNSARTRNPLRTTTGARRSRAAQARGVACSPRGMSRQSAPRGGVRF